MEPAHRLCYGQRTPKCMTLWHLIPAQHSTDEADDSCDLQAHSPAVALDDAFGDLSHEVDIVINETMVTVLRPHSPVGVKFEGVYSVRRRG